MDFARREQEKGEGERPAKVKMTYRNVVVPVSLHGDCVGVEVFAEG